MKILRSRKKRKQKPTRNTEKTAIIELTSKNSFESETLVFQQSPMHFFLFEKYLFGKIEFEITYSSRAQLANWGVPTKGDAMMALEKL